MGEEFKYIKVEEDNDIVCVEFLGNENIDRDDYLEEFIDALFLNWFDGRMHVALVAVREIVKNIFDHGNGKGLLTIMKENDNYLFEVIDFNEVKVSYHDVCNINKDSGWQKKSDSNFNLGMSMIKNACFVKEMSLVADDTKGGLNYFGSYIA